MKKVTITIFQQQFLLLKTTKTVVFSKSTTCSITQNNHIYRAIFIQVFNVQLFIISLPPPSSSFVTRTPSEPSTCSWTRPLKRGDADQNQLNSECGLSFQFLPRCSLPHPLFFFFFCVCVCYRQIALLSFDNAPNTHPLTRANSHLVHLGALQRLVLHLVSFSLPVRGLSF